MPELNDLPKDIYSLFDPDQGHECNEENLNAFADNLKQLLRERLAKHERPASSLRFSALGKPDRQAWFDAHPDPAKEEPLTPKTYLKFMYGDVIEQLLLFLAKEAGHSVEQEQAEVSVDGVKGHIDAIIDGVVVDVKSASPYGYKKFKDGEVVANDPFGYVAQLSGYSNVLTPGQDAAWLAQDKVSGDICISRLSVPVIKAHPPAERIEQLKKVVSLEEPPSYCHELVPDGKSGNLKLDTPCSYCRHKFRCRDGIRTFLYSTGPRFLAKVVREPDVPEVKGPVND